MLEELRRANLDLHMEVFEVHGSNPMNDYRHVALDSDMILSLRPGCLDGYEDVVAAKYGPGFMIDLLTG